MKRKQKNMDKYISTFELIMFYLTPIVIFVFDLHVLGNTNFSMGISFIIIALVWTIFFFVISKRLEGKLPHEIDREFEEDMKDDEDE